ncbi:uncharacterized protein [Physcomitrium patens]|uniref:uncharacterized protein n=1 Tax=Physcomitrium patens TaxID=3218 RepID=UPI000D166470|nr:uncharacterized protein LOC112294026 [Physcomitrium patens]|eukprot:XP_024399878.1 uncharacterized protein LOC112294026 [Physcomitrella patens]
MDQCAHNFAGASNTKDPHPAAQIGALDPSSVSNIAHGVAAGAPVIDVFLFFFPKSPRVRVAACGGVLVVRRRWCSLSRWWLCSGSVGSVVASSSFCWASGWLSTGFGSLELLGSVFISSLLVLTSCWICGSEPWCWYTCGGGYS